MICFQADNFAFPIKLEQNRKTLKFKVTYGLQIKDGLSYEKAALELGACIMHAAACNGKLDNTRCTF
jgi:hypothetical protein